MFINKALKELLIEKDRLMSNYEFATGREIDSIIYELKAVETRISGILSDERGGVNNEDPKVCIRCL